MNSSAGSANNARSFRPTCALAKSIEFTDDLMSVHLLDGRIIAVPLAWFPRLHSATPAQRLVYEIGGGGIGLHWPELDEDLSVAGLLAGADAASS
jgi:Protein of unknown function (DUF2442)